GGQANVASSPRALDLRNVSPAPVRISGSADFRPSLVTASSVFVIDLPTRKVLLADDADRLHPVASITKLMTGILAVDRGIDFGSRRSLLGADEIGGARLRVPVGTSMTFADLMYSMLVGSANNAAHAIGRIVGGGDMDRFVEMMNDEAGEFGLANTSFADPSGLEVQNVSTARELAALALEAWDREPLRRVCSTAKYSFQAGTELHTLTNTNQLLTDPNNGLIVLGGKTGYLIESRWNLVVSMKDGRDRPVLVVVLGADSSANLFRDARTAAEWAWGSYRW
ncbi:MAG: serine hydrolase, partial [bacterium]